MGRKFAKGGGGGEGGGGGGTWGILQRGQVASVRALEDNVKK